MAEFLKKSWLLPACKRAFAPEVANSGAASLITPGQPNQFGVITQFKTAKDPATLSFFLSDNFHCTVGMFTKECLEQFKLKYPTWSLGMLKRRLIKLEKYDLVLTSQDAELWVLVHKILPLGEINQDAIRDVPFLLEMPETRQGLREFAKKLEGKPNPPLVDELVELASHITQQTQQRTAETSMTEQFEEYFDGLTEADYIISESQELKLRKIEGWRETQATSETQMDGIMALLSVPNFDQSMSQDNLIFQEVEPTPASSKEISQNNSMPPPEPRQFRGHESQVKFSQDVRVKEEPIFSEESSQSLGDEVEEDPDPDHYGYQTQPSFMTPREPSPEPKAHSAEESEGEGEPEPEAEPTHSLDAQFPMTQAFIEESHQANPSPQPEAEIEREPPKAVPTTSAKLPQASVADRPPNPPPKPQSLKEIESPPSYPKLTESTITKHLEALKPKKRELPLGGPEGAARKRQQIAEAEAPEKAPSQGSDYSSRSSSREYQWMRVVSTTTGPLKKTSDSKEIVAAKMALAEQKAAKLADTFLQFWGRD